MSKNTIFTRDQVSNILDRVGEEPLCTLFMTNKIDNNDIIDNIKYIYSAEDYININKFLYNNKKKIEQTLLGIIPVYHSQLKGKIISIDTEDNNESFIRCYLNDKGKLIFESEDDQNIDIEKISITTLLKIIESIIYNTTETNI